MQDEYETEVLVLLPEQREQFFYEKKWGASRGGQGSGKSLEVSTPILTPDGYRQIGDLEVDDLVIGSSGRATHVTGIFPQGMLPGFRVVFSGGVSVVCSDDHLWTVQDGEGAWRTLPLSFLRESIFTAQAKYRWTLPKFQETRQRKIIGVSPIGDVEMVCISVEAPDGLFALGDGILTHNTSSWCYWLWLRRMEEYPESNFMAVGATYQQLRDGFFKNLVDALWAKGLAEDVDFTYRANPRPWLRFKHNGAKIHSWSADIVSRVRGANVQTLIVEEPQTWGPRGEEAWISLSGRLRHNERTQVLYPDMQPQGRISFNPTKVSPGHWLYDMLETRWPEDGYRCWQMSTRKNTLIGGHEEYVRNLEMSMAPSRWGVEIDGNYDTAGGSLYRDYNPAKHHVESYPSELLPQLLPQFKMDPFRPIFWTLDFNVEWQASVVLQFMEQRTREVYEPQPPPQQPKRKLVPLVADWQVKLCYVFDEIFIQDKGTRDVAEEFLRRYGAEARTRGVRLYGDASGGGRSQQLSSRESARTNWQIIIEELVKGGVPLSKIEFCVQSVNPAQTDRVNSVNNQFQTGEGIGFIISAKKCPNLLNDFRKVVNKPGTNEIFKPIGSSATPDQLKLTHLSDALGYCITMERKRAAGEQVKILDWRTR